MIRYGIRVFSGLLLILMLAACAGSETPSWLQGRWQVAYNPNNDDSDDLVFLPGSRVSIETEDGRTLEGRYQIKQDQLLMQIQVGQRNVETRFRISSAHDRLLYKNGAYYTKFKETGESGD